MTIYQRLGKPVFDRVLGVVLVVLTTPVLIVVALVTRLVFGSPAIRRIPHVGRDERRFRLMRFQTDETSDGDTRGRRRRLGTFMREWSLDELPQLWNVVLGHMSLVGPRPLTPDRAAALAPWQRQRHSVKPGLTGLWQVSARGDGRHMSENFHVDIQYIDQLSFLTDLRILARTVASVALHREGDPTHGGGGRLRNRVRPVRLAAVDVALWLLALILGSLVRTDFSFSALNSGEVLVTLGLAAGAQLAYGATTGMYRGRHRLSFAQEAGWAAGGSVLVVSGLLLATVVTDALIPNGALAAAGVFHSVGLLGARYAVRVVDTTRERSTHTRPHRLVIFGAGVTGLAMARAIRNDPTSDLEPVAFLDDDPRKFGSTVHSLTVVGDSADVAAAAQRYGADSLLIAAPSAPPDVVERVRAAGEAAGLKVQVMSTLVRAVTQRLVDHAAISGDADAAYRPSRAPQAPADRLARTRQFDLAIIGLGYVGLPVAVEASRAGVRVLGLDIDQTKVDSLNTGTSYIEDVPSEDLRAALAGGFEATTDSSRLADADVITISVPTPLREGLPDLRSVIAASEAIGDYLTRGQLVILESTTYPGTTEEVVRPILEERSGLRAGDDFHLAYSPERIDPGNPTWGIHNTPKLVGGIDNESTEHAALLYQKFAPVVTMSGTKEAEMAKLLENTYRHVNIALVNELAIFSSQLGVDIWETIRGAATKPFGFQAFYPGPGVGGHCIPIDPNYLSYRVRQLGEQFRFIELAQEINDYMPRYVAHRVVQMLEEAGRDPAESTVLLAGVAYKPGVSDTRETPATAITRELRSAGVTVGFVDPYVASFTVDGTEVIRYEDVIAAVSAVDLVLIHTNHAQFDISAISDAASLVLDTRGVADTGKAHRL